MAVSPGGVNPSAPRQRPPMKGMPLKSSNGGPNTSGKMPSPDDGAIVGAVRRRLYGGGGGPDMGTPERPPRRKNPFGPGKPMSPIKSGGQLGPKRPGYSPNV